MGRPPRIDRETIARAVVEIGFDEVTMKRTADHIGVSVPGLYHYVRGREDLIRLAADYAVSRVALPVYRDQTWQDWLREWARYIDRSMSDQPEVFQHFLTAGLEEERVVAVTGEVIGRLVDLGLSPRFAYEAWQTVSSVATGSAAIRIREKSAARDGATLTERMRAYLASLPPEELSALREVARTRPSAPSSLLDRRVDIVIAGLEAALDTGH